MADLTKEQREILTATAFSILLSTSFVWGFGLGAVSGLLVLATNTVFSLAAIPVVNYCINLAKKIKEMVDHIDEVIVNTNKSLANIEVSLQDTVKEVQLTVKQIKDSTLPQGTKTVAQATDAIKELQTLLDNISTKTLPQVDKSFAKFHEETIPAVNTVVTDVHQSMGFVNGGAQTASNILSPVSGMGQLIRKAMSYVPGFSRTSVAAPNQAEAQQVIPTREKPKDKPASLQQVKQVARSSRRGKLARK